MNKINVEVTFKDGVTQRYQTDRDSSQNNRYIRLFSKKREFLFNSDIIECIEILNKEVK